MNDDDDDDDDDDIGTYFMPWSIQMTLSDLELLSEIFDGTKHHADC